MFELLTVPALRGKDYGKSKMSYPDYIETESGLQYKVIFWKKNPKPCFSYTHKLLKVFVTLFNYVSKKNAGLASRRWPQT